MPYWRLAWSNAKKTTSIYSLWKTLPTIVIAVIQQLLYHGTTWERMFIVIGVTVTVYVVLLTGEFLVRLLIKARL